MKRIAFFVQHMICGGIETALINLCKVLLKKGCHITVYVISKTGEFINKLPSGVVLKEIQLPNSIRKYLPVGGAKIGIKERFAQRKYLQALVIFLKYFFNKGVFAELNVNFAKINHIQDFYDIAVNFNMHSPFLVRYLAEKVDAQKKYTWIHNDFISTGYKIDKLKNYLSCNDEFFAVSKEVKNEFITILPEYTDITRIALNIVDSDEIKKLANEYYPKEYEEHVLKILTIGRLEFQKGYDLAIQVCRKLKSCGLNFKWYVLGQGTEFNSIKKQIKTYQISEQFILLGVRANPYPYVNYCDIYIQPSRHEGWGLAVTEAKILCKPIIATNFAGAYEQLKNHVNGEIVDITVDSIFKKAYYLLTHANVRKKYSDALKKIEDVDYRYLNIFTN